MGQHLPRARQSTALLLVQPCYDRLHMYAEFLSYHGLAVIAVSDAWDALIAAPRADVIAG